MKTHRLIVVSALLPCLALLLGGGGGGCASEYAEPPPAAAGVAGDFAMLRAGEGVTIVAIDGKHVASGATLAHGDQSVRVLAGPLKVAAYVSNAAGNARFEVPLSVARGDADGYVLLLQVSHGPKPGVILGAAKGPGL